jgi:hypothetical protein
MPRIPELLFLLRQSPVRYLSPRRTIDGNLSDKQILGLLVQSTGEEVSPARYCTNCRRGDGPFTTCVQVSVTIASHIGQFGGTHTRACGNCLVTKTGTNCSIKGAKDWRITGQGESLMISGQKNPQSGLSSADSGAAGSSKTRSSAHSLEPTIHVASSAKRKEAADGMKHISQPEHDCQDVEDSQLDYDSHIEYHGVFDDESGDEIQDEHAEDEYHDEADSDVEVPPSPKRRRRASDRQRTYRKGAVIPVPKVPMEPATRPSAQYLEKSTMIPRRRSQIDSNSHQTSNLPRDTGLNLQQQSVAHEQQCDAPSEGESSSSPPILQAPTSDCMTFR